ncbi:MAG: hypothetical protein HUJ77_02030 [Clostridium sp.]|uniref:hypothetical protein n=1 Tax=Clostridium sp. TaxID=1506 RepID=UPI0025BE7FB3|nr:hypothetical protein [Clostridium sp.]MCF0147156.1 hypothetical protein [Clostridium sp.]
MKNKKLVISICSLLLILLTIGTVIYVKKQSDENLGKGLSGYILATGVEPDLTEEEIAALLQKQVDESKVVFSIYTEPVFEGKTGTIMFANPQNSAHNIDLNVTVGGKTVIKTDKIAPNQYIEEIQLMGRALKKGTHKGNALITAYKQDTGEMVGQVAVELDITSK